MSASGVAAASAMSAIAFVWEDVVELEAPAAPIVRVRWRLIYERVVAMRGPHVSLASSDTLAEGQLRW